MTEPEITPDIDLWIARLRKSLANDTPLGPAWDADWGCLRGLSPRGTDPAFRSRGTAGGRVGPPAKVGRSADGSSGQF